MSIVSLRETQSKLGAVFDSGDGSPRHFGDPAAEVRAAAQSAALFELAASQISITGTDRRSFLHNFCTNDINRLQPGQGCEAFLTSIKGRLLAHILVFAGEESLRLVSLAGDGADIVAHLDRYLISEDAEMHDVTDRSGVLLLTGPEAPPLLQNQLGIDAAALDMYGNRQAAVDEHRIDVARVPLSQQPAYLLCGDHDRLPLVWARLVESEARPAGREVWDAVRIAAGFPLYGVDVSEENIAQEAGRTPQAISFTKGCYLGQEPIARLDALGHVNRMLCGLRLEAAEAPASGALVFDEAGETQVGAITSAAPDRLAGDVVALAMMKAKHASPGARVSVRTSAAVAVPGEVRAVAG